MARTVRTFRSLKLQFAVHVQFVVWNFLRLSAGSILEPLLFNIFLCNLFPFFPDVHIANYPDDNTPRSSNINLNRVLHDLEKISYILFKRFTDSLLKANPEKSYLLTNSTQEIQINIGEIAIFNSKCKKLLGIHFDNKLTFAKRPARN